MRELNFASLDAPEVARHIAGLLPQDPVPATALLIAEHHRPALHELQRLMPRVAWQGLEFSASVSFEELLTCATTDRPRDAVVLLDIVARLPRPERIALVRKALDRTSRELIVAAPLGTDLQRMIVTSLAQQHRERLQRPHPLLEAHRTFGLPTPEEVFSWVRYGDDADLWYAGDVLNFRDRAEHLIRSQRAGFPLRWLARRLHPRAPEANAAEFPLETVPMRRHRRVYLHLRRA